jgi:hypothetical protein
MASVPTSVSGDDGLFSDGRRNARSVIAVTVRMNG